MEQVASAPVLWNSSYVDYGSFQEVISRSAKTQELSFSFRLSADRFYQQLSGSREHRPTTDSGPSNFTYDLFLGPASKGRTKTLRSIIRVDDDIIEVEYDRRRRISHLTINGVPPSELSPRAKAEGVQRGLVPIIQISGFPQSLMTHDAQHMATLLASELAYLFRQGDVSRQLTSHVRNLFYRPKAQFKQHLLQWLNQIPGISVPPNRLKNVTIERVRSMLLLRDCGRLSRILYEQIYGDLISSQYIGPIRARAERYYRIQELAIDHIDPNGENVAMYLNFLTPSELKNFNSIFYDAFGYTVEPYQNRGHVSLLLKEGGIGRGDNIADVGFGFSQVIPVVAQIFAATKHRDAMSQRVGSLAYRSSPVVAVEQPELHLHPAFQAKLADLFAQLAHTNNPTGRRSRFVIETHSEAFVNRLGRLIADGVIKSTDVTIYTFEKNRGSGTTVVNTLTFGDDGLIENWPVGFFSAR